jgi:hypothetical protein
VRWLECSVTKFLFSFGLGLPSEAKIPSDKVASVQGKHLAISREFQKNMGEALIASTAIDIKSTV